MSAEIKPLFRSEALRPVLNNFEIAPSSSNARVKIERWANLLAEERVNSMKETELLPDFLSDVFGDFLGYRGPAGGSPVYTLRRESLVEVDGKRADGALGRFGLKDGSVNVAVVVEGKGPRDPLDRPFAGRKRSAVEQALQYAVNLRINWYLVTNLREIRLYNKSQDQFTLERFETTTLASDDAERRRFAFLLGADRVAPDTGSNHLDKLLTESRRIGQDLTKDYYRDYAVLRRQTLDRLRHHNPGIPAVQLLAATQKILDRVLFIAFCEDRGLLPREIIAQAYQHSDLFTPQPVWNNFLGLFRSVDLGNDRLKISRYNGGLFAPDEFLEKLIVPDDVCLGFKKLADYEYGSQTAGDGKLIDVEILGHIFEQSISDLEEMQRSLQAPDAAPVDTAAPSKRKRQGAFYTPAFVTRFIVSETLGPVLADRFKALRDRHESEAPKSARKALADPRSFDPAELSKTENAALRKFWHNWTDELETVRIVDPSCGSGAFLIEAFDQMFAQYSEAQAILESLGEGKLFLDVRKAILTKNLFGMDLNSEAVEIARLSCWIKTAETGKILTALDDNIKQGNSVVAPPAPIEAWKTRFPDVFAHGGFDVVIGNPPYVRQEWIKDDKPFLQVHYQSYDGVADLYVYFYELGLKLLKPGGRLGFIVTNKWMKAGYGEPLRQFFANAAWISSVVDFGHAKQIFPDADVFPCILVAQKPADTSAPESSRVCIIAREQLDIEDLSRQIAVEGIHVPRARFGKDPWNLEPPGASKLMMKLNANGKCLREFSGVKPLLGIKTALNEAFLIDNDTKERLVAQHQDSASIIKPYLRGQDVDRWSTRWSDNWMIVLKSSNDHIWPWSNDAANAEAIFRTTYPAVFDHLNQFREAAIKRQDQGKYWWELRSCAFWESFKLPKIWFQQIQFHPCYAVDTREMYGNNKTTFLPCGNLYLLAVLNSPLLWWHNFRFLPHMKDEALAPVNYKVEEIPIATPTDDCRSEIEAVVQSILSGNAAQHESSAAILDWLRLEFAIEKPTQKLSAMASLDANEMIAEVKKIRGKKSPLSVQDVKRLKEEHAASVVPLQMLAQEAARLESRVSDLVNAAYGLTPEEIDLLWKTAPPRMPIPSPK